MIETEGGGGGSNDRGDIWGGGGGDHEGGLGWGANTTRERGRGGGD